MTAPNTQPSAEGSVASQAEVAVVDIGEIADTTEVVSIEVDPTDLAVQGHIAAMRTKLRSKPTTEGEKEAAQANKAAHKIPLMGAYK